MTKAIFFDFDGTLANTAPGIVLTMQETFREMGLPVPGEETIRQTIGLPLTASIRLLGNLSEEDTERGVQIYRRFFSIYELTHITMFPEVAQTIAELSRRGIRLAICTSRGTNSLKSILSRYDLLDCFETAVTATDNLPSKPAPDMVLTLLERMGLSKDEIFVVGDTTFDIDMGNNAGCRTIAVTYGNHTPEQLRSASPTHIINHFSEILLKARNSGRPIDLQSAGE